MNFAALTSCSLQDIPAPGNLDNCSSWEGELKKLPTELSGKPGFFGGSYDSSTRTNVMYALRNRWFFLPLHVVHGFLENIYSLNRLKSTRGHPCAIAKTQPPPPPSTFNRQQVVSVELVQ